ncbi:branched-chain amino acid ABC transporter permease [Microbacterium karelineae]|uniref:branched-chain amino acid ABC transporter permease n=1 Tax=Microbacterium karelineae TaxID=2654283 RepID=UPI0012EAAFA3|nr:branched-chain amino acid ABC transporter permease [Microbacterium karelineae]
MNHATAPRGRVRVGAAVALLTAFLAVLVGLALAPQPASAADGDPYTLSGNVHHEGEPLEGVALAIDGPGGEQLVVTDAEGRWQVKVPERGATYTVALDEETLPDGVTVIDESGEDDSPNVVEAEMGAGGRLAVNFFIGEGERNTVGFVDQLVDRVFKGINFGLMLALAAVGISLVYGTTKLSNFAHAEMVTFGAVVAYGLAGAATLGLPLWLALILTIVLAALMGLALDVALWKPLRRRGAGVVQLMIVSIGLSLAMRFIFQFFIGGGTLQLPPLADTAKIPLFGAVAVSPMEMMSMALSLVVLVAFAAWLTYSRVGKATRAISDNPALASATGIDVDKVVRIVWVLSGAMAGLAGVLYAYYRPGIRFDMGMHILLLVFAAVTLGGLGTAYGALVGALIVGVLVEVSSLWIPADLRYVGALFVLILVLLLRPQGLLGRRERIG